jgi:hypothetical protein
MKHDLAKQRKHGGVVRTHKQVIYGDPDQVRDLHSAMALTIVLRTSSHSQVRRPPPQRLYTSLPSPPASLFPIPTLWPSCLPIPLHWPGSPEQYRSHIEASLIQPSVWQSHALLDPPRILTLQIQRLQTQAH